MVEDEVGATAASKTPLREGSSGSAPTSTGVSGRASEALRGHARLGVERDGGGAARTEAARTGAGSAVERGIPPDTPDAARSRGTGKAQSRARPAA